MDDDPAKEQALSTDSPPADPGPNGTGRGPAAFGILLLTFTAVPAAVLVVSDAVFNVVPAAASALGLHGSEIAVLLSASGLALPALVAAVPLAAVAARRLPAWPVLATGIAVLLAGLAAARFVHSVPLVGLVRAAQGAGAGIVLPASLVLVQERASRGLTAAWAGALAGTLILAMPLTLSAVPASAGGMDAPDWRAAIAPFPWPAAAAAVAVLARPLLRRRGHPAPAAGLPAAQPSPVALRAERAQLLLPLVPVAGFAFVAVIAAHDWSPGARLVVAACGLVTLLGLGTAGGADPTAGSPHGCAIVMIAVGLLCHPVAAPMAGLAAAARPGDGAATPLLACTVAAAAATAGAIASTRCAARLGVTAGYCLLTAAPLLALVIAPHDRWAPLLPLVPLGAGAGLALAASLRGAGTGAALFGLSLCFPAVLAGQLLVLSLQAARLESLRPGAGQAGALLDGYHLWLAVAALAAVLLAAVTARGSARATRHAVPGGETLPVKAAPGPRGG